MEAAAKVHADPHAELPTQNYKYVKNCTELFLAQRGIEELANFDGFVNLEVLWLNGNRLEALEHLDHCVRIKQLYAQGNRIRSLRGSSLVHFRFLDTLRLNDNKLRDFQTTLAVLARLHHLEDLDLYGNPLEEEDNYRLHVIRTVPSLLVLDRHLITEDERRRASRLRDDPVVGTSAKPKPRPKKETIAGAPPQTTSGTVKMLFKEVERIAREEEAKRKADLKRELRLINHQQQQQQLTASNASKRSATSRPSGMGGLDAWELAALAKKFRSLEDKPEAGVALDTLTKLLDHLGGRGYHVRTVDGTVLLSRSPSSTEKMAETFKAGADATTKITWTQMKDALTTGWLQCELMPAHELAARAEDCFGQAAVMQKRALVAKTGAAPPVNEIHEVSQRAYHLASLAEIKSDSETQRTSTRGKAMLKERAKEGSGGSPQKTKFYLSAFGHDATATAKFHELKEQSNGISSDLATKYKLQQKDFQKYLLKQAPPATTIARRQFHL